MTLKIAIITSIPSENNFLPFHIQLQDLLQKNHSVIVDLVRNGELQFCLDENASIYHQGKEWHCEDYQFVLSRFAIKTPHGGDYYILRHFESLGIPVVNTSFALVNSRDKFHTLQLLQSEQIPITPTVLVRTKSQIKDALAYLGPPPYIVKNCFGSGGKNVLHATTESQVLAIFDYLWHIDRNDILLLQKFHETTPTHDVRVFCLGYSVAYAVIREAPIGEFRANVKVGAKTKPTLLSEEERLLCCKAAKVCNLPICGIDFLRTSNGPLLLEVNGCPGIQGLCSVYGDKVVTSIAEFLYHSL